MSGFLVLSHVSAHFTLTWGLLFLHFPKVRLGPLRRRRLQWGDGRALRLGCARGPTEMDHWEVATWENTLWKLPVWKNPLGKYPTSSSYGVDYFLILHTASIL